MKRALVIGTALAFGVSNAMADCTANGGRESQANISSLLENNTACGHNALETWNEQHLVGRIHEIAQGPSDPVDPSADIGTYTITSVPDPGNPSNTVGVVTYTYNGGGGTYAYYVDTVGGATRNFCPVGGGPNLTMTISGNISPRTC